MGNRASFDFAGSVVVVTGAGHGMGRDIALSFGAAGAPVVAAPAPARMDLPYPTATMAELEEVVSSIAAGGGRAVAVAADVRDEAQVERMIEETIHSYGQIDILVNNAGVYIGGVPLAETTEEQWDTIVDVNLKGAFNCVKHAASRMVARGAGGRIVVNSSTSALIGIGNQIAYQSSKAGLLGMIRTLAVELGPSGITANAICPAIVRPTTMSDYVASATSQAYVQEIIRVGGAYTLFGDREGIELRDVSDMVLFLASDSGRFITGTVIPLDGGYTAK
jgi:NAD(P)-dependent dehydrogenase (short-subunit alcohol dehydrogenase family)